MPDEKKKPAAPAEPTKAQEPAMKFPHELRRHFYDSTDWTMVMFMSVSLTFHMLVVGGIATREWKDPSENLTREQLLALQDAITKQFEVFEEEEPETEEFDIPEIDNPEFEKLLADQLAQQEASLQTALQEAQDVLAEMDASMLSAEDEMGSELDDLLAGMDMDMDLDAAMDMPTLDIAPTDVAIFAEVSGGAPSRVVAQALDIQALGSDVQISASFTKGGLSAAEASRLTSQIQLARKQLGGNMQLRVASGLGDSRRAALRVAGGKTGARIQVEQLALPPTRAAGPGGRDQQAVEAQAAKTRGLIGGCYTIGLAADPTLTGVVVVRFTIGTNGVVSNVGVSDSNIGNSDVESCVVAAVTTWKFQPAGTTDTFEFPFTFEPG